MNSTHPGLSATRFAHQRAGSRYPPAPADCYRFVLSHPDVNVCFTAPSTAAQMEENLRALDAGPLNEEEMTQIRRIGKHIYEKK